MTTVPTRTDPALVRLELDPAGSPAEAQVRLVVVAAGGTERELAAWSVREPYRDVVLARSDDGTRAGVLIGDELRTVALEDGATVDRVGGVAIAAPVPGVPTDDPATFAQAVGAAWPARLVWVDGLARAVWPEGNAPRHAPLADGWSIELAGDAEVDPDQATGHNGGGGGAMMPIWLGDPPTAEELPAVEREMERLTREMRAEDERRSRESRVFRLVARRAGRETIVHHEDLAPLKGVTSLHWPPIVTPHGLLLRRSVSTSHTVGTGQEMQHPWLVTPEGEVRTLPFELGVGPRDTLPDGRLLLPGYDALWWDGSDEAPSALTLEGDAEPLRVGPDGRDDYARPHRLLRDAFADLRPAWPPPPGDEGWHVVDLRVDAEADEVIVLLVEGFPDPSPAEIHGEGEDPTAWAVVALGLGGDGPVRGIAHGTRPAGAGTSFAL